MNITYKYDLTKIENNFLEITFSNENNLNHIDSIKIPIGENGNIDDIKLNEEIEKLYQKVLDKKNTIFQ